MKKGWCLLVGVLVASSTSFAVSLTNESFEESGLGNQWTIHYGYSGNVSNTVVTPVAGNAHSGDQSLAVGCIGTSEILVGAKKTLEESLSHGKITLWHYDAFAGESPYYTYINVSSTNGQMGHIGLRDQGYSDEGYRLYLEESGYFFNGTRSVGWHEFSFSLTNGVMSISIDGEVLASGGTTNSINYISLTHYSFHGGTYSSLFDDLLVEYTDGDGDGMDDAWETYYFGDLSQNAITDFDLDGRTNGEEEMDGTDPTDAGSTLGLMAYFPFNGNANDKSLNGYDGVVSGATLTTDRYGIADQAYSFDGSNDIIAAPISSDFTASNYTINCWVMFDNYTNQYPSIIKGTNNYLNLAAKGTAYPPETIGEAQFYQQGVGGATDRIVTPIGTSQLTTNRFYCLTVVKDDLSCHIYLDGTLHDAVSLSAGSVGVGDVLFFGGILTGGWSEPLSYMDGVIDDVRIYDRALSSNEVVQLSYVSSPLDTDGDGLSDGAEVNRFGTNPLDSDSDGDGFDDGSEITLGLRPTNDNSDIVAYVQNHGFIFDLYPSNVVMDVSIGQVLLGIANGNASLSLQLEKSDDLITWTNAGDAVEWSIPASAGSEFYRVRSSMD